MNPRTGIIILSILAVSIMGCETTQTVKSTITSKVAALTASVDENLYAQVPGEYQGPVKKAEEEVKAAEARVALAKQKKELADARSKLAGYALDLEEADGKIAKISVDTAKVQAMIEAGVGENEKNEKLLSDLRVKKAKTEADKAQTSSKMTGTEEHIRNLEREIASAEEALSGTETAAPASGTAPAEK